MKVDDVATASGGFSATAATKILTIDMTQVTLLKGAANPRTGTPVAIVLKGTNAWRYSTIDDANPLTKYFVVPANTEKSLFLDDITKIYIIRDTADAVMYYDIIYLKPRSAV